VAYSKGMPSGFPVRVVLVCVLAGAAIAQAAPGTPALPETPASPPTATAPEAAPPTRPTRRPVAVIDLSGSPEGEAAANEILNELANHVALSAIVRAALIGSLKGPFADEERPALEAARRAKQEADDFLADLDYRAAETAAERGIAALQNVRPSPDVLGLYAELAFAVGQAELKLRKPNDASLAFGLSFRLDSGKRPDPTRYEPEFVEAYNLASTKTGAPVKLEVKGQGTAWIDGIDRGTAPGVFDLSPGLHLVQLSGPERETRGAQVDPTQTPSIEIPAAPASDERKVERARVALARTKDSAARAGAVKRLAQLLGVGDAVVIEKLPDGSLRAQTWRDRAPGFTAPVAFQEGKSLELLAPLAPPRKAEPKKEEPIKLPPIVVEEPLYRKRWFQGAVATGVLAVAATVFLIASQDRMIGLDPDITSKK
jgi:hypothetical protein